MTGSNANNTTILTMRELEIMRAKTMPKPIEDREARRNRLKELSDARVQQWPNTLAAVRKQKENWAKEKEDRQENERKDIDRQEAAIQRKLRVETIRNANNRMYEQTDKMKTLRSAQIYAEVLETRKEQVLEKEKVKTLLAERDVYHHNVVMRKIEEGEKLAKEAAEARIKVAAEIAQQQTCQLDECKEAYIARLVNEKKEGELQKQLNVEALAREKEEAAAAKIHARLELEKMMSANASLKELREEKAKEELETLERCVEERKTLDRVAKARKDLEKRRFAEKQGIRQKLIDRACAELAQIKDTTEHRELKQAKEQRDKEDQLLAYKQMLQDRQKVGIDKSRAYAKTLREAKERESKEEDATIKAFYKDQLIQSNLAEKQRLKDIRDKNMEIRATQEKQMLEKRQQRLAEKALSKVEAARIADVQRVEKETYNAVVEEEKKKLEDMGFDSYMLARASCA